MPKHIRLHSNSVNETRSIAEILAKQLSGKELILLCGDLGTGKTVFSKGIGCGLGIEDSEIVSPTFTLQNYYESAGVIPGFFHFDLYRIGIDSNRTQGLELPEIDELLGYRLIVVEWAQYLHTSYFKEADSISIKIEAGENGESFRKIQISCDKSEIIQALDASLILG